MSKLLKKAIYLRENQVDKLVTAVYDSYRQGTRKLSESMLCRVALDLLFSIDLDLTKHQSEAEIFQAALQKIKKQG